MRVGYSIRTSLLDRIWDPLIGTVADEDLAFSDGLYLQFTQDHLLGELA